METRFRSDLVAWLRADPILSEHLNALEEENPLAASPPWLGIAASASADWSSKSHTGREVRVALELLDRDTGHTGETIAAIEHRIGTLPPQQDGYRVVVTQFLRSRAERRERGLRAVLLEYRFRLIEMTENQS